jgi:hypothetical protein
MTGIDSFMIPVDVWAVFLGLQRGVLAGDGLDHPHGQFCVL